MITAPIGPETVTVLGYHWPKTAPWDALDFKDAELWEKSIWGEDYHLRVPFWDPDEIPQPAEPETYYRIRLKRGWKRFVQIDGVWMVAK